MSMNSKTKAQNDKKKTLLASYVASKLILYGYNKHELAILIGFSHASLYKKLNDPEGFTLKELRRLFTVLKFTDEEKLNVI